MTEKLLCGKIVAIKGKREENTIVIKEVLLR